MNKKLLSECTTIIAGDKMTADGSFILSRSSDFDAMMAINFEIHEDTNFGPEEFVAKDSKFRCPLPKEALGYSALPDYQFPGEWGSAGFNTLGVGMSSTETIFSSQKALNVDPYVTDGLAENCTYNIVLPYIHSAREGVERLGMLIEKYGSAEGFGIGFIDKKEIWYLENAGGHRYLACKMPRDRYFVTGNQSRYRDYDPKDKENFIASKDLIEFAKKNKLWNPANGKFDFHEAYTRDEKLDTTYNYPRVWGLQKMFSPSIKNDVTKNTFPIYTIAEKPMTISDFRKAFRYHYDNTEHDPYLHSNGKEPYRPVGIFRTTQTHLLQVRPNLPKEIGCVSYVAMGMSDLGVFLPLYQGVKSYPATYKMGNSHSDNQSAYWKFRKVMTLGMVNYNAYAPIIKEAYSKLEAENDQRQKEMEKEYLKLYKNEPIKANEMLQQFSDSILNKAECVAESLIEEIFTRLTLDIQKEYMFHGA
ncbi:MAG: C69 family dipeptidase [Bacteroidales bacterium]|jgi:dipeptidase|nr:C69 family dipeptidase [Bacteroidales bacterium]